ncbi:sensor histidine kinase [Fodinibacter luteus]|uniref:sensor histidine kinase n=1 Tax=Fodinibacter luteus TaxID=552064 RepID=UPI0031F1C468
MVVLQLADALRGGVLVGTPIVVLGSAVAGYLVGLTCRWPVALGAGLVAASVLTWAHQVADPGVHPVPDDFMFSLLCVGAPALAGAVVQGRSDQVRELRRVAGLLEAQRGAEVRRARLEERNRLQVLLYRGFSEQVAAIAVRAESAVGAEDAEMRRALADIEGAARASLDELRGVLGSLRDESETNWREPARTPALPEPVGVADIALGAGVGAVLAVESVVSPQAQGPALLNVLVALLAAAPLIIRRQHPLTACALTLSGLTVMAVWLTPPTVMVTSILAVLVCGYVVGAHGRGGRRIAGAAVVLGALALLAWADPGGLADPAALVPMLAFTGTAVGVGVVSAGWSQRAAELVAAVVELERGREVEVGLAVAEQRNELAGELHDTVAHAMTVICLQASAGQVRPGEGTLDTVLDAARSTLHELRDGLGHLAEDGELGVAGLTAQARRVGLSPQVRVTGRMDELPPETRSMAARVLREALTNASRYAPSSSVRIEVATSDVLRLSVLDEGPNAPPEGGLGAGTGLATLAQEVSRRGGTMSWGPSGEGFRVSATLPGIGVLA